MKKAIIVIDKYKLHVFEQRLQEAGIEYEVSAGITPKHLSLSIYAETMQGLLQWRGLIEKINHEATR